MDTNEEQTLMYVVDLGSYSQQSTTTFLDGSITISDGETPLLKINKTPNHHKLTPPLTNQQEKPEQNPHLPNPPLITQEELQTTSNEIKDNEQPRNCKDNLEGKQWDAPKNDRKGHLTDTERRQMKRHKYVFKCKHCDWTCPGTSKKIHKIQLHLIHHPKQTVNEKYVDLSVLRKYGIVK